MLFAAVRKAGWASANVRLEHLAFGSMLGPDGKPFKTREGGTVKLKELLEEAIARARRVVEENATKDSEARGFSQEEIDRIAHVVGTGAVKYFDLSHNLTTDYRFDWDSMLSLDGNTAPYMLYAYARIRSIGRKAGIDFADLPPQAALSLVHESEVGLAKAILRFPEVVQNVVRDLRPNYLTDYLFDLSRQFSRFYDRKLGVRVVDAETPDLRASRLRLCDLTARVIRTGLHLLGIETLEQM
jgi:arginyl-tRNA synthetase